MPTQQQVNNINSNTNNNRLPLCMLGHHFGSCFDFNSGSEDKCTPEMLMCGNYYEVLSLTGMPPQDLEMEDFTNSSRTHRKTKVRVAKTSNQSSAETEMSKNPVCSPKVEQFASSLSAEGCPSSPGFHDPLALPEEPPEGCGYSAPSAASQTELDGSSLFRQDGTPETPPACTSTRPGPATVASSSRVPTDVASVCSASPRMQPHHTEACADSVASTSAWGPTSSISREYHFLMWYHEEDTQFVERIYNFLEGELKLCGYMHCRDGPLGKYELVEQFKAIELSKKIFLFITPQAMKCGMFEYHMVKSYNHSVGRGLSNVIPIYWQLDRSNGPGIMHSISSIYYQDCSETFKKIIANVFKIAYPSPPMKPLSRALSSSPCAKSPHSAKLKPSKSLTTPKKKSTFWGFLGTND